nr:MAG TPA: receptor binding protein [Caudoviricetes sp.]
MKTFVPGEIARASDVNSNFTEILKKIDELSGEWQRLTVSKGWETVAGHEPQARMVAGLVVIEGAVVRRTGGYLNNLVTLPPPMRPRKTQFIGTCIPRKDSENIAFAELFTSANGQISIDTYTTVDSGTGWLVPLAAVFYPA